MPDEPQTASKDDYSRAPQTQSLEGYFVVRGYNEQRAFSSTLDLPSKEEAVKLMEEIHPFRGKGEARADGTRDQNVYYEDRKATDTWLREQAGITEERQNPIFFAVTKDPSFLLDQMGKSPYSHVMVVPLDKVDPKQWTFTVGDSMGNFFSKDGNDVNPNTTNFLQDSNPLHGKVRNIQEIVAAMEKYPTANGGPRAFEGQFWGPDFDPRTMGGEIYKKGDPNPLPMSDPAGLGKKDAASIGSKFGASTEAKTEAPAATATVTATVKKTAAPSFKP